MDAERTAASFLGVERWQSQTESSRWAFFPGDRLMLRLQVCWPLAEGEEVLRLVELSFRLRGCWLVSSRQYLALRSLPLIVAVH